MADINSIHDIASSIIECMDMESYSELPEEEHYMYLEKDLIECESKCPDLFEYVEFAFRMREHPFTEGFLDEFESPEACKDSESAALFARKTDYGTSYGDIARFLLSLQPMGKISDYDDFTHYSIISEGLSNAPDNIKYYLSVAFENRSILEDIGRER